MRVRVLIAEDDPINRRLLEVSLTQWGYEPVIAVNGEEAWEILQAADAPSLAVLDWMMPRLDGPEVCQRVRAAPEPRQIYIIMLTAKGQTGDVVTGLEAGADDYIVKPFDPPELRTRLRVGLRLLDLQQRLMDHARELEAARAHAAEQERFAQAVSQMSDAIVTLDAQCRVLTANRSACLLLDLPADQWPGMALGGVLAPFEVSIPPAELCAGTDPVTAFEISRPQTHPPLLLDARLSRVLDASGRLDSAVLIVRDVTGERLRRNVQASFMTAVPHKLRTPLTLLRGFLGVAQHMPPGELLDHWPHMSQVWEHELQYLESLVQKLLDFEHLTALELKAELLDTDVAAAANRVCEQAREQYPDREVKFTLEVAPAAARAACGTEHLQFILRELVDNALKFADKQPARVTLAAEPGADARLRFTVTDNGPGIPHESYDRILEGFVQVEEHVTGQIPGWGVGLHMARQVVEAYGGTISVRSELGLGSTFTFTLPAPRLA